MSGLKKRVAEVVEDIEDDQLRLLCRQELARLSFYNMSDFLDSKGNVRPLENMDEDALAAIRDIKITRCPKTGKKKVQLTLHDKNAPLERLTRILGMYEQDNKQGAMAMSELFKEIAAAGGITEAARERSQNGI